MRNNSIAVALAKLLLLSLVPTAAFAGEVENKIVLRATEDPARNDNPACADDMPNVAKLVAEGLYGAADSYIGAPIVSTTVKLFPKVDEWFRSRGGLVDGRSNCSTLCVVAPENTYVELRACMSDSSGEECFTSNKGDSSRGIGWSDVRDFQRSFRSKALVACVTGKNWSHDRDRIFEVKASWPERHPNKTAPDVAGTWGCTGDCSGVAGIWFIEQDRLRFKNEHASSAIIEGSFDATRGRIKAEGWNLWGQLSPDGQKIDWENSTDWERTSHGQPTLTPADFVGSWKCIGQCSGPTEISTLGGNRLRFKNEANDDSEGYLDAANWRVFAEKWNLWGNVSVDKRTIDWENPTDWVR